MVIRYLIHLLFIYLFFKIVYPVSDFALVLKSQGLSTLLNPLVSRSRVFTVNLSAAKGGCGIGNDLSSV